MSETVLLAIIAAIQAVSIALGVAYIQSKAKDREERAQASHNELSSKVEEVKNEVQSMK